MTLATNLKQAREAAGLTVRGLATKAHVSIGAISDIENGRNANPTIDTLRKLALALATTPERLCAAANDPAPEPEPEPEPPAPGSLVHYPPDDLTCDNYRQSFDLDDLSELALSIAGSGLLHPLLVRPLPEGGAVVIDGERRLRAIRIAIDRMALPPDHRIPCIVSDLTGRDARLAQLSANIHRADVNPMEEARLLHQLVADGLSTADLAASAGKSQRWVQMRLDLARRLSPTAQAALQADLISAKQARALTTAPLATQDELLQAAQNGLTFDQLIERIAARARFKDAPPPPPPPRPALPKAACDQAMADMLSAPGSRPPPAPAAAQTREADAAAVQDFRDALVAAILAEPGTMTRLWVVNSLARAGRGCWSPLPALHARTPMSLFEGGDAPFRASRHWVRLANASDAELIFDERYPARCVAVFNQLADADWLRAAELTMASSLKMWVHAGEHLPDARPILHPLHIHLARRYGIPIPPVLMGSADQTDIEAPPAAPAGNDAGDERTGGGHASPVEMSACPVVAPVVHIPERLRDLLWRLAAALPKADDYGADDLPLETCGGEVLWLRRTPRPAAHGNGPPRYLIDAYDDGFTMAGPASLPPDAAVLPQTIIDHIETWLAERSA